MDLYEACLTETIGFTLGEHDMYYKMLNHEVYEWTAYGVGEYGQPTLNEYSRVWGYICDYAWTHTQL